MWKFSATMTLINLLLATVQAEEYELLNDYIIAASNQGGSYHYPAPPPSQQLYDPVTGHRAAHNYRNPYQGNYHSSNVITKQFVSHALDNVAFSMALTNQGYKYGNAPAFNAALTARSRTSKTAAQTKSLSSSSSSSVSSSSPVVGSLNIKLPLPLGFTPLNIAPLPLQAGTPYSAIRDAITSYGTIYPQRKRR